MIKWFYILLITLLPGIGLFAQEVTTIATNAVIRDGLHTDDSGNIYVASGGFAGFTVGKYQVESQEFLPRFASGFQGPVDVDVYHDSLMIVTNYDNNTVSAYNLNTQTQSIIASGLDGPSGIAIDHEDNIYVASWGGAPAFAGNQIHKISPSGDVNLYIRSSTLFRPQAMTVDQTGTLIVHARQSLYKVNPADSSLRLWVNVGMKLGHLIFRNQDRSVYATAVDEHKIVAINSQGIVNVFAGSTIGYRDGASEQALFNSPLGIELSPDESTLYVSEFGYGAGPGRIRQITFEPIVSTSIYSKPDLKIYPNPTYGILQIDREMLVGDKIEVYDLTGKLVVSKQTMELERTIDLGSLPKGQYLLKIFGVNGIVTEEIIKK